MRHVDNTQDYAHVGTEGIGQISVPYSQFCYQLKTALKNKIYFFLSYTEKCQNKTELIL